MQLNNVRTIHVLFEPLSDPILTYLNMLVLFELFDRYKLMFCDQFARVFILKMIKVSTTHMQVQYIEKTQN